MYKGKERPTAALAISKSKVCHCALWLLGTWAFLSAWCLAIPFTFIYAPPSCENKRVLSQNHNHCLMRPLLLEFPG